MGKKRKGKSDTSLFWLNFVLVCPRRVLLFTFTHLSVAQTRARLSIGYRHALPPPPWGGERLLEQQEFEHCRCV